VTCDLVQRRHDARGGHRGSKALRNTSSNKVSQRGSDRTGCSGQPEGNNGRCDDAPRIHPPQQHSHQRQRTHERVRERGDQNLSGLRTDVEVTSDQRREKRGRRLVDDHQELRHRKEEDALHLASDAA